MTPSQQKFLSLARNPFKMGFFMLTQLPAAFFSGVRAFSGSPRILSVLPILHAWRWPQK